METVKLCLALDCKGDVCICGNEACYNVHIHEQPKFMHKHEFDRLYS